MTIPIQPRSVRWPGKNARRGLLLLALLIASAWAWTLSGCKSKTNSFAPPPPPEVTVAHPTHHPVTRYFEYTGSTEAYQSVELRARVAGFLEQVVFKPGAAVKKGDLLFVIDKRTFKAAVDSASAAVEQRAAQEALAKFEAERVAQAAADKVVSDFENKQKQQNYLAAKAQTDAARAQLESAKLDLEFCEVRAPIDGRITKNLIDVGNLVGAAGQPTVLANVVSGRPLYVTVDASESDVMEGRQLRRAHAPGAEPGQIAPGEWRPVDMAIADSDEFNNHGHIDYVDPALNPQTGTIRVRCRFENENDLLLPGQFVRLRILLDTADAMLVPDIALLSDQNGRFALVVDDKDTVELRRVKIGTLDGAMRVVIEGLSPSDRVVVNGLQRARPGLTVKPTLKELESPKPPATTTAPAKSSAGTSGAIGGDRV